jgi:hypothetical protein
MKSNSVIPAFRKALQSIGYDNQCIASDYSFADFSGGAATLNRIPLAAFSDYPFTYRTARIGVFLANGHLSGEKEVLRFRALGAPLVFEVGQQNIRAWSVGFEQAKPISDAFSAEQIESIFGKNKGSWNPKALGRVRSPADVPPKQQRDFFDLGLLPVLEGFFQDKLKDLLERTFQETAECYKSVHSQDPDVSFLFPYLFRFVTAKIFMDRADAKGWDNLGGPREILEKAERHSGSGLLDQLPKEFFDKRVLTKAWECISETFHFQNLSVPDLAFIYESSFINKDTRRKLGIHSTPRGLADYIVENLPWEDIPVGNRHVFEPFCGHGIFLACALERLDRDLDPELTGKQRHSYFRRMLVGVEKDPLALEVCRLVLTLSDYPNENNWQLHHEDIFSWSGWDSTLNSATVVLANPPYEPFPVEERQRISATKAQPPAEFIYRLMRKPPTMLGLVLPQSFLSHPSYQEANRQIASYYEQVSIVELPPLFNYADNETIALLASGRNKTSKYVTVRYAEVRPNATDFFLHDSKVSGARSSKIEIGADRKTFTLWIPPKGSLFDRFGKGPFLKSVANLHQGIKWIGRTDGQPKTSPRTDVASNTNKDGFLFGVEKMAGNLTQFQICVFRFLSLLPEHHDPRDKAWQHPWRQRKVVCNAGRLERKSPWRLAARADSEGLAFTKQFIAIWPKDGVSEFALAAILCSPIANAFSFEKDLERHNHIATLERLPVPAEEHLHPTGVLHRLAEKVQSLLTMKDHTVVTPAEEMKRLLLSLDAAVLEAYELTPREQRRLLDQFKGWKRPIAVPFTGYFPDHFKDMISLQDFVAIQYDWDTVNERRCDLIEKDISGQPLTDEERDNLDHLQHLADLLVRLKAPYPLDQLDDFIEKLKAEGKWKSSI